MLDLTFLTEYVYSLNLERARLWLSKINSSTIGTMRRTAITVNYLQNAVSSGGAFLLSSKSCFSCWGTALVVGGTAFFEEFTLFGGVLACFLRRVALHAVLSAFGFFEGLLYLRGCLACGVAWLVERWSFISCFSVSINKLKIYE